MRPLSHDFRWQAVPACTRDWQVTRVERADGLGVAEGKKALVSPRSEPIHRAPRDRPRRRHVDLHTEQDGVMGRMREGRWLGKYPLLPLVVAACLVGAGAGAVEAQTMADLLAICQDEAKAAPDRIAACTRIIEDKAQDEGMRAEALIQRGVLYELRGDREDAVSDYSEAIKLEGTNALPYFNRGNVHDQLRRFEQAIADYTEAIRLDPSDPDFYNNRGQTYDSMGEHDRAIVDYTEAIRLDKSSARPWYNRGLSYANKGDYKRAIADFDEAIKRAPDDADLYVARGAAKEELSDRDAALRDYRKALEIDADHEDALEGINRLGG